ncbi:hypothetical protein J7481_19685 [Labrenzia sp. R4_2]|uniref:hypothetical protein n=1 Tax=Labrenzia sp. R4_2 TaxID=2821107 RepID=UPI001ADB2F22|nr:hypothetical protein [Labrenzia sp. R4_2]MBO9421739.1 hypothetical protein [Labrenzia sp. R4_2]
MSVNVHTLISEQVEKLGSKQAVADRMGVSRTMVSLYLSGRYADVGGRNDKFEQRALALFSNRVTCPHLQTDLSHDECAAHAASVMPMSDPKALKLWVACKSCALKPLAHTEKEGVA